MSFGNTTVVSPFVFVWRTEVNCITGDVLGTHKLLYHFIGVYGLLLILAFLDLLLNQYI